MSTMNDSINDTCMPPVRLILWLSNYNASFEAINPFTPGALVLGHWHVQAHSAASDWDFALSIKS